MSARKLRLEFADTTTKNMLFSTGDEKPIFFVVRILHQQMEPMKHFSAF